MRRQGAGFGFVMILVVMVVVLMIALKNWSAVAPTALEIKKHNDARARGENAPEDAAPNAASTSSSPDSWNPAPPSRPNLSAMEKSTDQHSDAVKSALSQTN
jgi:hypothetical protein